MGLPLRSETPRSVPDKIVSFINVRVLNLRLFEHLWAEMDADRNIFLFYTNIRWLSKDNVTK